jgi:hypothetical protein
MQKASAPGIMSCINPMERAMTDLLEKALTAVAQLPPAEQDALAAILLAELASEQRWADSFARSQAALEKLAEEALSEHRAGLTKPL